VTLSVKLSARAVTLSVKLSARAVTISVKLSATAHGKLSAARQCANARRLLPALLPAYERRCVCVHVCGVCLCLCLCVMTLPVNTVISTPW
jgi:hypothetical protein